MRRRIASRSLVAGAALLALAGPVLAGCADNQPGDVNNGPGYTNSVADLKVKVGNLRTDPCRSAQATQVFANCGRFVTEVANTVAQLRDAVPSQGQLVNGMQDAVNNFQKLGCDTISGTPSAQQQTTCPTSLTTIGTELDQLAQALASTPSSS